MNAARRVNKTKIEPGLETSGNSVRIGTANSPLARGVELKHGGESPEPANSNSAKHIESGVENGKGAAIVGRRRGGGDVSKRRITFGGETGKGLEGAIRWDTGAEEAAGQAVTIKQVD